MPDSKRIAKNTLFLYFRMFITMGVGLYTSRVVLQALGVVDYGIYGLVGGIVTMFAFLNSSMSAATQRYLSFDIGKGDLDRLKNTFTASLNIHFGIGFIIIILAETIGLWFVNHKLNIPANRMTAANWVYQFSIITFFYDVIQVPYDALLIAREHMNVYAYISIVEAAFKLGIALIIIRATTDRLILYAILIFVAAFISRMLYKWYCKRHFKEAVYHWFYDKSYYKELISFSGWNLFGNIAIIARDQGSNILLNLFFGPVVNAAYGLSQMLQSIIGGFISNFQVALNPQIIKKYANGEISSSVNLIYLSSKFSFFAMLLLIVPFILNTNYILSLWLGNVPPYTVSFVKLALVFTLLGAIANPLTVGIQATGRIKLFQAVVGTTGSLSVLAAWVVFKIKKDPVNLYWVLIAISIVTLMLRVYFMQKLMHISIGDFFNKVILKVVIVSAIVLTMGYGLSFTEATNFFSLLLQCSITVLILVCLIFFIGLQHRERSVIFGYIKNSIHY